jgi:hypothetical protein
LNYCKQRTSISKWRKKKRAAELVVANKELLFRMKKKENAQVN